MPPARLSSLVACALLCACQSVGPRSLQAGRGQYNIAIQRTNGEQLLLNLVRLRYRDSPLFLEVTSISSSLSLELTGGVEGNIGAGVATPAGSVNYTERPTITYAPLQGERFGQQFLAPIGLRDLLLLYHSGWAIDRIFKVFLQRMGPLPNAPRASGPTPDVEPLYREFFHACELLRRLWSDGKLDLAYSEVGEQPVILLRIDPTMASSPEVATLARLLGLPAPTTTLLLSDRARPGDPAVVPIVPRSLLAAMYYASQGIEVPPEHARDGRVTTTRTADGRPFDWRHITGRILQIKHAKRRPVDTYVAVFYRDLWWYIDDSDLDSKSTFSFISQTLELQSGDMKHAGPVLTLPISAN